MSVIDMWLEDYCKERLKQNNIKLPVRFSFIGKEGKVSKNSITCYNNQEMVTGYLACHHYPGSQKVVILKEDGSVINI